MKIVIYGLTITSSWGNSHAITYRSLAKALARKGHTVHFVEKDVEWYRNSRDLPQPEYCTVRLYEQWGRESRELVALSSDADVVLIGSYFPDAIAATRALVNADYGPILFYDLDTPITLSQLREQGRTAYLDLSLIPLYDAYLSSTGGPALYELQDDFGASWGVPFYCSVDADVYRRAAECPEFQCDLSYLGTYARDRQARLMQLLNEPARMLPDRKFIVAGPQYPAEIPWQPNVGRMAQLSAGDHPCFYSSSRFSLHLTRADMSAAGYYPSARLFEASACGAAVLSDHWEGIEEFFTPGEEILLPRDARAVAEIVTGMSDEERTCIGARARERVLSQHTSDHRAAQFEEIVATCSLVKA
jgi:spore maturation protein CgeB